MQTRCRLIQNIDGIAGTASAQLRGQLYALGFAAGERRGALTQADIAQTYILKCFQFSVDFRDMFKKFAGFIHRHFQNIGDAFAFECCFQCFPVVASALADFTGDINIGEKMHLDLDDAVALTGFTAAALHIKAEAAFFVAPGFGFFALGKEIADRVENAGISRGVAPGRPPDGALIDGDHFIQMFQSADLGEIFGRDPGAVQFVG